MGHDPKKSICPVVSMKPFIVNSLMLIIAVMGSALRSVECFMN